MEPTYVITEAKDLPFTQNQPLNHILKTAQSNLRHP
jgi:hypothetical protein